MSRQQQQLALEEAARRRAAEFKVGMHTHWLHQQLAWCWQILSHQGCPQPHMLASAAAVACFAATEASA